MAAAAACLITDRECGSDPKTPVYIFKTGVFSLPEIFITCIITRASVYYCNLTNKLYSNKNKT